MSIKPEELYMLLGESMAIRFKLDQQIRALLEQADQMAQEITKLRTDREDASKELMARRNPNG
jgi:hypothetical protein